MMKRFLLMSFLGIALFAPLSGLQAQQKGAYNVQGVAAIVNDGVVTDRDLEHRMRLSLLSSRNPPDAATLASIRQQVLRRLIDEQLQIQEGQRARIMISDEEIAEGVRSIEQQNGMPPGILEKFLDANGIDIETIRHQIRAELSWVKVVRQKIAPTILVADEEIDHRMETLRANRGKPEYLSAEIFLAVENPGNEAEVAEMARRLIGQMMQGAHFSAIARQFSDSGGASGGDLGWVSEGMIDPALFDALSKMEPGSLSPPLRLDDGYHILLLRDRRRVGEGESGEPTFDLALAYMRHISGITRAERLEKLRELATAASCEDFESAVVSAPMMEWNRLENIRLSQLSPDMRSIAAQLQEGKFSPPIEGDKTTRLAMLCKKTLPEPGMPSRDEVGQQIEEEKVQLAARTYQRDLRRAAFVEFRR